MSQKPDEDLINKVIKGENNAYAILVDRYKHMVYTLALKIVKNSLYFLLLKNSRGARPVMFLMSCIK